jgi:hypothetical protein
VVRSLKEKRFVNGGGDSDSSDQGAGALVGVDAFFVDDYKILLDEKGHSEERKQAGR